jgi:hypothetical protein
MISLRAYFDSSGQVKDRYMTLAAFVANEEMWKQFETDWNKILGDHCPKAPYVHMRELVHQRDGFDSSLGWTNDSAFGLSNKCLVYMSHLDKKRFRMVYSAVDLEAWRKLRAETYQLPDPVDLCVETCQLGIFGWYMQTYPDILDLHADRIDVFFDQGEPFKGAFEKRWREEKKESRRAGKSWDSWRMISRISTVDMRQVPGVQAADVLAWAVNRDAGKSEGKGKYLRHIMHQVIPATFAVWDEAKLRKHHKRLLYV